MAKSAEYVETSGGARIYVEIDGAGTEVVFVAGLGDERSSWDDQISRFRDDFRCVSFDNRGIGKSSCPEGPYTMEQMASDAHDVVVALGIGPAAAVGSSMGGGIVERWALDHPDDVRALVLTSTWGGGDPYVRAAARHWSGLAAKGLGRELLESLLLFSFSPDYLVENPGVVEEFLSSPIPPLDGLAASASACATHDVTAELSNISQPTLVIHGTWEPITRPALARQLAERIPDARIAQLDAGHMTFWERPDEWEALVRDFFESL